MFRGGRQVFGGNWEGNAPAPEALSRTLFDGIVEGKIPRRVQNKLHNPAGCGPSVKEM
jgi:hypothetical protein